MAVIARSVIRSSWRRASQAASCVDRGSSAKNAASRSPLKPRLGGSCHSTGPSLARSASTPDAKKFASGVSTPASFFMCVTNRGPLTAKVKSAGVSAYQLRKLDGRCSE